MKIKFEGTARVECISYIRVTNKMFEKINKNCRDFSIKNGAYSKQTEIKQCLTCELVMMTGTSPWHACE